MQILEDPVRAPYRLDLTATVLRRLSTNVVDVYTDQKYCRLLGNRTRPAVLEVMQTNPDSLTVRLHGEAHTDAAMLVRRMLGTDVDLRPFYAAAPKPPWLCTLAEQARGVKPPRYPSLWEAIVNAVVYQQVSIHAAGAILRRIIERYEPLRAVGTTMLAVFPGPQLIAVADPGELRSLGLSANKIVALRALAQAVLANELDEAELEPLQTTAVVSHLQTFKGIGPWTAAVIALRGFGRLDVFPLNDSGVARGLKELSGDSNVDGATILKTLGEQRGMLYYHLLLARLASRGEVKWNET